MGNLFAGQPKVIPEFTGLQVNTAVQVLPIPIIYGSPRVQINMIYYNGFYSQRVSQGGKGILSGGKGPQSIEYFATIILALGEGPLGDVKIIYQDSNVWTPETYPTNGTFYFNGTSGQAPWSYVISHWPADPRPYKNTAYYGFSNAQLDSSATVPQINVVAQGFLTGTSPLNNSTINITTGQYDPNGHPISYIGPINIGDADADPAQVIYDFLTNSTYGATFPKEFIDTSSLFTFPNGYDPNIGDAALSTFCQAAGLAWSVVVNNVESANSILDRWCGNLNVAPVWNGATLRFIPYWDRPVSTNPGWDPLAGIPRKYFVPNVTSIVTITLDQILQSEDKTEDPISFTRKDPFEVYNTVRLDFKDRTNFFNDVPAEAKDEAHIELYGPRVDNIGLGNEFSLAAYANVSVTMQLRRNVSIMRTFVWKLGPLWGWLDPMNIVTIPDPTNYANFVTVRITNVEDDDDENVTVTAEEFPIGAQSPSTIPLSPTTPPYQGPLNIPCSNAYAPVIFVPTTDMLAATGFSTPQWILGCSGGNGPGYEGILDPNWGGVNIWVSLDDVNYQLIGTLTGPSTVGSLSQPLGAYGGISPDMDNTLYVNLSQCNGALGSLDPTVAAAGNSICCVQDVSGYEIVAYTTSTLVGNGVYALTGLYRGLYGTTARAFGTGSQFLYVGATANIFEDTLPLGYIGMNFWIKPQSFNSLRNYSQDLSDTIAYQVVAYSPTPAPPIPPPSIAPTNRRLGRPKPSVPSTRKRQR